MAVSRRGCIYTIRRAKRLNIFGAIDRDNRFEDLTLKSEGSQTKEEATTHKIKKVRLHLRHDKSFENDLQDATFIPPGSLLIKEKL